MAELRFNTSVARLFELNNALVGEAEVPADVASVLPRLLSPLAPHISEELWHRMGKDDSIVTAPWPRFDASLIAEDMATMVVQVNGRVRGRVTVPAGIGEESAVARALAEDTVRRFVDAKPIKKTVYVPDKLVNLVI